MATVDSIYLGNLRTKSLHIQSKTELLTDAPTDNQGKGEYFSPTDLVATALGTCIMTTLGIAARNHGISIEGANWATTKIMGTNPRRIVEIIIDIKFANLSYTEKEKEIIRRISRECPVAVSLHPDLKQTVTFNF